jgi:16S rRNA (guanine(1405)-N(7))-methyltransferase
MQNSASLPEWVKSILQSKKYKNLNIPLETIQGLLAQPEAQRLGSRELQKWLKRKLHNIVADYLGDPDYNSKTSEMDQVFSSEEENLKKEFCRKILQSHASTRERLEHIPEFYDGIFRVTGKAHSILDLACGLNPFAFPWMGLDTSTQYHAYDIHQPRIDFINHYFGKLHLALLAEHRDILVTPPTKRADIAFLFKEAHRLDQRQKGCNRILWQAIQVNWLLVSLPANSLSGKHDLVAKHRKLVKDSIGDSPWKVTELQFGNEMVFCIDKSNQKLDLHV